MMKWLPQISQWLCLALVLAAAAIWVYRWLKTCRLPGEMPDRPVRFSGPRWRHPALQIAACVLVSRLLLLAAGVFACAAKGCMLDMQTMWSRWDAPHYLDIAQYGYIADQTMGDQWLFIVFFPLYPALVGGLGRLLGGAWFTAAVAVSWVSLYGACYALWRLSETELPGRGMRAVYLLLLAPTSVFLGIPYTESLYLCLSIVCLLAIRQRKWLWAGVAGCAAALARNVGILLVLAYAVEYLAAYHMFCSAKRQKKGADWLRSALPVLLIPAGTAIYLLINYLVYGDAMMFMSIQKNHWYQQMQPFYLSVSNTVSQLLGNWGSDNARFLWGPQLIAMVAALAALPHMMRRLRPAWGIYLLAYLLVILSPSWLLSFPRYLMGAAPIYIYLADALGSARRWHCAVYILLAIAAIYLTAGYALGYSVL